MASPSSSGVTERLVPHLRFVAAVGLKVDSHMSVGETPDGVRMTFTVHGAVRGPELNGKFRPCSAYLRIDRDGVGTIHVRAPIDLDDGTFAELESTGRYDFGEDGYAGAVKGELSDSALGWCPRFVTAPSNARHAWLNRTQFLGIGMLRPKQGTVDYDLFAVSPRAAEARAGSAGPTSPGSGSLYQRLGGQHGIDWIANDFTDALMANDRLHQQNPKVFLAHTRVDRQALKKKLADIFCSLTGGPCTYAGRPLGEVHAPLDITEADWAVAGEALLDVLTRYNVAKAEQDEFFAILEGTKPHIVTAAQSAAGGGYPAARRGY
jgi:hemoglobin